MLKIHQKTAIFGSVSAVLLLFVSMLITLPQDRVSIWVQRDLLPQWKWTATKISIFSVELSGISHSSLPAVRVDALWVKPDWSGLLDLELRWKIDAEVAGQHLSGVLTHSGNEYQLGFAFESVDLAKLVPVVLSNPILGGLLTGNVSGNAELLFYTSAPPRARVSFKDGHISSVGLSLTDITGRIGLMNNGRWVVALQSREGVVLEGKGGLKYSVNSSPVLSGSIGLQTGDWSPLESLLNSKELKLDLKGSLDSPRIRCNPVSTCAGFI